MLECKGLTACWPYPFPPLDGEKHCEGKLYGQEFNRLDSRPLTILSLASAHNCTIPFSQSPLHFLSLLVPLALFPPPALVPPARSRGWWLPDEPSGWCMFPGTSLTNPLWSADLLNGHHRHPVEVTEKNELWRNYSCNYFVFLSLKLLPKIRKIILFDNDTRFDSYLMYAYGSTCVVDANNQSNQKLTSRFSLLGVAH